MTIRLTNRSRPMGGILIAIAILLLTILFLGVPSLSDGAPETFPNSSDSNLRQSGRLLTVSISERNPIRVFVVGREEAKVDLSKLKLTIRRLKPYPGSVLSMDRSENSFTVSDEANLRSATMLEVVTQVDGEREKFHFKIAPENP